MLIGAYLNQLKELAYVPKWRISERMYRSSLTHYMNRQPDHVIEICIDSLKHFESLALSSAVGVFMDFHKLLRRFDSSCKNIKYLQLNEISEDNSELFKPLRLFQNIRNLELQFKEEAGSLYSPKFGTKIESLLEHFPLLQYLKIRMDRNVTNWSFVLNLLRKRPFLEKINIYFTWTDSCINYFSTFEFYNDFVKLIIDYDKPDAKIKIILFRGIHSDYVIGSVTKVEVIWREKLIHRTSKESGILNILF